VLMRGLLALQPSRPSAPSAKVHIGIGPGYQGQKQPKFVEALESEAIEQLGEIRAARTYQGSNPDYQKRAKIAIGVIGAYVRLRATMANEKTNELVEIRMLSSGGATIALPPSPQR
jgi:hypothetical protein